MRHLKNLVQGITYTGIGATVLTVELSYRGVKAAVPAVVRVAKATPAAVVKGQQACDARGRQVVDSVKTKLPKREAKVEVTVTEPQSA